MAPLSTTQRIHSIFTTYYYDVPCGTTEKPMSHSSVLGALLICRDMQRHDHGNAVATAESLLKGGITSKRSES
jgi:hypothetical protein